LPPASSPPGWPPRARRGLQHRCIGPPLGGAARAGPLSLELCRAGERARSARSGSAAAPRAAGAAAQEVRMARRPLLAASPPSAAAAPHGAPSLSGGGSSRRDGGSSELRGTPACHRRSGSGYASKLHCSSTACRCCRCLEVRLQRCLCSLSSTEWLPGSISHVRLH